jgi:Signal transduction histidine kinase
MEAIGQLTGGVAHDFNNLLTVISGNLEMLERRLEKAEDREILQEAQEASQLGAELSKRLLAFGRRQSLDPKPTDPNGLVSGMVDWLRRSLGATIEIETRLAENVPMIMVDPGQVENALLNLAVNARDAMPNGGRLIIESGLIDIDKDYLAVHSDAAPGTYVMLAVTDTGAGMSPEVHQRAFEPFYTTKGPAPAAASASAWFTASSSNPAAMSNSIASQGTARRCGSILPAQAREVEPAKAPSAAASPLQDRARGSWSSRMTPGFAGLPSGAFGSWAMPPSRRTTAPPRFGTLTAGSPSSCSSPMS